MSSKNDEMDVVFKQSEKTQSEASCRGNVFLSLFDNDIALPKKDTPTHTHLLQLNTQTLKHQQDGYERKRPRKVGRKDGSNFTDTCFPTTRKRRILREASPEE